MMWSKKKITLIQYTFSLMSLQRVHCPEKKVRLKKKKFKKNSEKKKSSLTVSNHNHMTFNSMLKKKDIYIYLHLIVFCSKKFRKEASDNDNMKQVWKIMAV